MLKLLKRAIELGVDIEDDESLRLKKISITMVPFIIGPVGLIWSIIIFFTGDSLSATIPFVYTVSSLFTLLHFYITKNVRFIVTAQMSLILLLPFFLSWSLGGFTQGSYIFIWAFFAPIISLIHNKESSSLYWLYAFVGLVVFSVGVDGWLIDNVQIVLPRRVQEVFFFLNIVFALSAIYFLINYFIDEKDKNADDKLEAEHNALLIKTEELEAMLYQDSLLGIGNRNALLRDIEQIEESSFILINIDSFNQINTLYGEDFGNQVLIVFAKLLDDFISEYTECALYRLGGDEFVILSRTLQEIEVIEYASTIVKNINENPLLVNGQMISLNITVAISLEEPREQLKTANMALKIARKDKLDLLVYSKELSLDKEYKNNFEWINEIKEAISDDRIVMFYQPIIDNENPKNKKYETLVRLIKKDGTVVSPYFFLEIAKKAKLYKEITKIVIRKSFEAFKDNSYDFSVNITIDDILDNEIHQYIINVIKKYDISTRVIFEIVESESIENFEEIEKFITEIKSYGCRIAIDDFGTGYSNFEYLMRLQADFIKIDGSIIKEITTNKRSALITSVIVVFAKELNIKTIGEYVENAEIQEKLISLGVNQSQGYYFDEPLAEINP